MSDLSDLSDLSDCPAQTDRSEKIERIENSEKFEQKYSQTKICGADAPNRLMHYAHFTRQRIYPPDGSAVMGNLSKFPKLPKLPHCLPPSSRPTCGYAV